VIGYAGGMSRSRVVGAIVLFAVACGGATSTTITGTPPPDAGGVDSGRPTDSGTTIPDSSDRRDTGPGGDPNITCDEAADCDEGRVCCAESSDPDVPGGPRALATRCLPTCITGLPRFQVCRRDDECENGSCKPFDCGERYRELRFCQRPDDCQ
jgi:hypothetical protein